MLSQTKISPKSWLAFDLNVVRRLKFDSVLLPFTDRPALGAYLKRWNARVMANDPLQSSWVRCVAQITNGFERLSADDVNTVLEDAYVPGYKLINPSLTNWFSETDSWWFDNVRRNIDRLQSSNLRAIASTIAMATGDYVLSFADETRELRQPLSNVFRRLWSIQPEPHGNGQENTAYNRSADDFLAEATGDLMFLRLPGAHAHGLRTYLGRSAWREEWLRQGSDFWDRLELNQHGKLGAPTETKSQYLHLLEATLRRASHIRNWALAHVESGFITTQDIVDTIAAIRRVDTIYTKDFSELTGTKAVIITA
ncbi:MAG: hypothetical protein IPM59_07585 [Chloracidobacterium sp.]|nr:hypothetical protein [Chloracidobacterium sp.]